MKVYQAKGNGSLTVEMAEPKDSPLIKIRIIRMIPTNSDLSIFAGSEKRKYPFIMGHTAIGVVSDDRPEYGLKRGSKVILNPYQIEQGERLDMPSRVKTAGVDFEGFMQELVYLPLDKITPFPEDVKEDEAIFSEKVAIAMAVINSFRVEKGDYIAILGASPLCNIIAQLAIYFQMIPIMIDTNEKWLQKAEDCGVYYTINSTKEIPYDEVLQITGGRMAEHTVIEVSGSVTGAYLFSITREGGDCTVLCENNIAKKLDIDVSLVSKRQLRVRGVSNGAHEFDSAINIIAQKILNLEGFIEKKVDVEQAELVLRHMIESAEDYYSLAIDL